MANVAISNGTMYYKNAVEKKQTGASSLGKDEFLKILVTQLSNQDPTQPLQDREFIAQMAQFTSVEQLTNMSKEMSLLRQSIGWSSSLLGTTIAWTDVSAEGERTVRSGRVDAIQIKDGKQFARVEERDVALDQIVTIEP